MQTNKDTEKKNVVLHEEKEVASLRLDIAGDFILIIYRNLATFWWWETLEIKARVEQDLANPNQYNLYQTEESAEYDPIKYPLKPYRLGYLVITRVDKDIPKPVDVKLVCGWAVVLSFWTELELNLRKMFPVIEQNQIAADSKEVDQIPELPNSEIQKNIFRKTAGNTWEIAFQGCEKFYLSDMLGLLYIHQLLSNPRKKIHVTTLERGGSDGAVRKHQETDFEDDLNLDVDGESYNPMMDKSYMDDIRNRLRDLSEERLEAESNHDEKERIRIDDETEKIEEILNGSSGRGGRSREMASEGNKARQRVTLAIKSAIKKIETDGKCPDLAKYLTKSIDTGAMCEYVPIDEPDNMPEFKTRKL